jgi:hypothetical protein
MLVFFSSIFRPAFASGAVPTGTDTPSSSNVLPEVLPLPPTQVLHARQHTSLQQRLNALWHHQDTTAAALSAARERACIGKPHADVQTQNPVLPTTNTLDLSHLPVTDWPSDIISQLPAGSVVILSAKGLDPELVKLLELMSLDPHRVGAKFKFNDRPYLHAHSPLHEQVEAWQHALGQPVISAASASLLRTWEPLSQTPQGQKMATFLWRLREAQDFKNPGSADNFQRHIKRFLSDLGQCRAQRERCLSEAQQALASPVGGDELAYALVKMEIGNLHQKASGMAHQGRDDKQLEALIELARGLYCFEQLEAMADQQRLANPHCCTEPHTLLAYLVYFSNLPKPIDRHPSVGHHLNLPVQIHNLCNPNLAALKPQDLVSARLQLHKSFKPGNDAGFTQYLNQWPAMQVWREQKALR